MVEDMTFELLQEGRITTREYLMLTRRRFDNIERICPRAEVVPLLRAFAEIEHMQAPNSPPDDAA
jgi:hypothetical protein